MALTLADFNENGLSNVTKALIRVGPLSSPWDLTDTTNVTLDGGLALDGQTLTALRLLISGSDMRVALSDASAVLHIRSYLETGAGSNLRFYIQTDDAVMSWGSSDISSGGGNAVRYSVSSEDRTRLSALNAGDIIIAAFASGTQVTPGIRVLPTDADVPSGYTHFQFMGAVSELRAYDRALDPEEVLHNYHARYRPLVGAFHIDEAHALPGVGNGALERFAGAFVAFLNGLLTQRGTVAEYGAWKTIKGFTVWDPDALQLYVSDGVTFQEVYGIADLAPEVSSLRTLGAGAQQMSPGNHADNGGHPLSDLSFAVNPAPNVGGLRTLYNPDSPAPGDDGSQSAAAGNHGH